MNAFRAISIIPAKSMRMNVNAIVVRQETDEDFRQVNEVVRSAFLDVAETDGGRIIGHILLSKAEVVSEERSCIVLALAPLSVLPEFQGKGIGSMLVREAHRRAAELGYGAAVLLGHWDYYPRFGYRRASLYGIKFPFDAPDECCMAVELTDGGLDGIHGTVRYPEAFHIG